MSYYHTCPRCGAHLDPDERCDCLEVEAKALIDHLTEDECTSVLELWHNRKAVRGATNTTDGKAEKVLESSDSASIVH